MTNLYKCFFSCLIRGTKVFVIISPSPTLSLLAQNIFLMTAIFYCILMWSGSQGSELCKSEGHTRFLLFTVHTPTIGVLTGWGGGLLVGHPVPPFPRGFSFSSYKCIFFNIRAERYHSRPRVTHPPPKQILNTPLLPQIRCASSVLPTSTYRTLQKNTPYDKGRHT